jgi:hypothetical protein
MTMTTNEDTRLMTIRAREAGQAQFDRIKEVVASIKAEGFVDE